MSIKLENVSYTYGSGTPYEKMALSNINLEIKQGEFVGIIGHTGSGKSTLVQHLNGLLQPMTGVVTVNDVNLSGKDKATLAMRRKVGMVFQYPEHQLFEETIALDIAFGPKNMGVPEEEIEQRVHEAMDFVGLDYKTFADRSPFRLSGGQMRRVAIAGVIVLRPDFLVLDEPSAGLDPAGREEIFGEVMKWHRNNGLTVILVSHNMEDISRMADRVIVLDQGKIALDGDPLDIFEFERATLQAAGVDVPPVTELLEYLKSRGLMVNNRVRNVKEAVNVIYDALKEGK